MQNKQSLLLRNQIPKNWQKVKLGDLLKDGVILQIQDGNHGEKHPKQSDFVKNGDRVPFIMANDLNSGKIDFNNCNYVSKKQADNLRVGFAKSGDVLLTHKGNLGLVSIVPRMEFDYLMLTPQVTYYRVDKNRLDNHFLKYVFLNPSFQKELQNISPQSTRPYVGITAQKDLEINFIEDIQDQKEIADILSDFDDKIELNNKIAKTSEEIAQVLFKEWFVKFKFPGYEKAEFIDNELGKIPKGWLSDLGNNIEVTDYVANGSFASLRGNVTYYSDKNYAVLVRTKDLQEHFVNELVYIDQNAYEFLKKSKLFGGELILSNVGNVGAIFRCPKLNIPMSLGPNAVVIKNGAYTLYLLLYFRGKVGQSKLRGITGGSSQPKFNKTDFRSLKLIFPPETIIEKFNEFVEPMYERIDQAKQENKILIALRDLLLPKLMRGEIRV